MSITEERTNLDWSDTGDRSCVEPDVTMAGCEIPGWDEKIPGGGNQDNGDWLSDGGYGPWNELGDPFLKP